MRAWAGLQNAVGYYSLLVGRTQALSISPQDPRLGLSVACSQIGGGDKKILLQPYGNPRRKPSVVGTAGVGHRF